MHKASFPLTCKLAFFQFFYLFRNCRGFEVLNYFYCLSCSFEIILICKYSEMMRTCVLLGFLKYPRCVFLATQQNNGVELHERVAKSVKNLFTGRRIYVINDVMVSCLCIESNFSNCLICFRTPTLCNRLSLSFKSGSMFLKIDKGMN